ncbi:transposase [Elysia marginata]|uniref:Transposase n=1 Tax=Elysia marginata TaxID=1093978 RepID=A0AAV4I149_9GAST|nr:transposase [Elysia marginata]
MWVDGQGYRPVVLSPGFQSRKRMFTVFFNYSGPLVVDMLPQDTTMTATYYIQNMLSQVKSANNEQRPRVSTSRTLLLHDNAGPHKAKATTQSLRELGIQVLYHPAFNTDLAPYDFWLLTILKNRLAGQKFDRIQDPAKALNSEPRTVPEENYQGVFRKWQIRLKCCRESHGEYFEDLGKFHCLKQHLVLKNLEKIVYGPYIHDPSSWILADTISSRSGISSSWVIPSLPVLKYRQVGLDDARLKYWPEPREMNQKLYGSALRLGVTAEFIYASDHI